MTENAYIIFLGEHFESCLKMQMITFGRTIIFTKDYVPLYEALKTSEYR